jgi:nitrosocyanin
MNRFYRECTRIKAGLALGALMALFLGLASTSARAEVRSFQMMSVEVNGVKFWIPSTLTVKKGDTVKIRAVSKVPGQGSTHGLAIDEFKIQEVVDEKGKDIQFNADKAGIYPIRCHLHPAHVGGQLVVLD